MNIVEAYLRIKHNWKLLLIIEGICVAIAFVIIFSIPKEYTSKVVMAPETKASSSSYGLEVDILQTIGNTESGGSGFKYGSSKDAIYPMIYPLFFESPTYPTKFFNIKVPLPDGGSTTFRNYVDNDIKYPWWDYIKDHLLSILKRDKRDDTSQLAEKGNFFTQEEWETIKRLQDRITLTVDKKDFVMTLEVNTQDPVISAIVADSVSVILKNTITEYRTNKARENLDYIQSLYDNAQKNYLASRTEYYKFLDSHFGTYNYEVRIIGDQLKTDADINFSIYNQLAKQLQLAKSKVMEDRPVFAVLESPTVSPKASYPPKLLCLIGFGLIGLIIFLICIFK